MTTSPSTGSASSEAAMTVERGEANKALVMAIGTFLAPIAMLLVLALTGNDPPEPVRMAITAVPLGLVILSCCWSFVVATRASWPATLALVALVTAAVIALARAVSAETIDDDHLEIALCVLAAVPVVMALGKIPARAGLRRGLLPLAINLITIGAFLLIAMRVIALDE